MPRCEPQLMAIEESRGFLKIVTTTSQQAAQATPPPLFRIRPCMLCVHCKLTLTGPEPTGFFNPGPKLRLTMRAEWGQQQHLWEGVTTDQDVCTTLQSP